MRAGREHLITTADAATVAGVKEGTIHQWAGRGFLTKHGTGKTALWDWRELADVMATRGGRRRVA